MTVTAVIPNWNRRDLLVRLLDDLQAQTVRMGRVIVVDNGSTDGSVAAAREHGAEAIALPVNRGFAAAVNEGIRAVSTEWVAILNNDVRLRPDWLEQLLRQAEADGVWFAAGKLLQEGNPEQLDGSFDLLSRAACAWRAGHGKRDQPAFSEAGAIHFAPMTAALFRRGLFEKVGLLDEAFESYLEDVEFGLRCALAGCTGVYAPKAVGTHAGSATLGQWNPETVRRIARNQLLLIARHYPPDWIRQYGWPVLVGQLLWGALAWKHGTGGAWLRGKQEGIAALRSSQRRPSPVLRAVLEDGERRIRELQRQTGYDWFWRIYCTLT